MKIFVQINIFQLISKNLLRVSDLSILYQCYLQFSSLLPSLRFFPPIYQNEIYQVTNNFYFTKYKGQFYVNCQHHMTQLRILIFLNHFVQTFLQSVLLSSFPSVLGSFYNLFFIICLLLFGHNFRSLCTRALFSILWRKWKFLMRIPAWS